MPDLKLNEDFNFEIQRHEKRVRLIVFKAGVENVCRKESLKNLLHFIQSDEVHLFKGRLQLHENTTGIGVIVKGNQPEGNIKVEEFIKLLGESTCSPYVSQSGRAHPVQTYEVFQTS
ncbi:MAG: hypothetical protein JWP45_2851 [Mucilaginibacter sp.]|jgi:hypothetical protein|nr:hypothetical protein [Mucilaginibacter sp.]MDB5140189.1 hypothetical protein [Mucilaginibacter sp.]